MKYVLEPMLFAFDQELTEQELTDYLEELLVLDEWWDKHREDMFVQETTGDVLYACDYYPTGDALKPLLEKHRIKFVQYRDVEKIVVKMLDKSKKIDEISDGLCGMKSQTLKQPLSVNPNIRRPAKIGQELMNLLWLVFKAREVGGYDEKSFVVITKGISEIVGVEYEYEELEEIDGRVELKVKNSTSEVNCKGSLDDFLSDDKTPFFLWKTAERKADLDFGIRVAVMHVKGERDLNKIYKDYSFVIQDSFYKDYCDGHYKSKDQDIRSTIQSVADALMDQNMRKVHAIRIGAKGNNPPLVRENYDAQRRDITTSIKLAYWKKGHELKFANMREHDFFEPTWED